jgi:hypothetical protein
MLQDIPMGGNILFSPGIFSSRSLFLPQKYQEKANTFQGFTMTQKVERDVEHYRQKLAHRLNCRYCGTMIRGGLETIHQIFPPFLAKRIVHVFTHRMRRPGKAFGETGTLNATLLKKWAYPESLPLLARLVYRLYALIGINYLGFDAVLKINHAFQERDATPYLLGENTIG